MIIPGVKIRPSAAERKVLIAAGAFTLILNFLSWNFPVFWDSILHSRISIWFFETGFSSLKIPLDMDALHPPLFNIYIAVLWKILGPELWVTHLAILPFSLGIIWQIFVLSKRINPDSRIWVWLIVLLEPCLLAQTMQMSPDICLVFFYFFGLNALLAERRGVLAFAVSCMAMLHFRGVLMAPALWMTGELLKGVRISFSGILRSLLPFLPAAALTIFYLIFHYSYAGWFFRPPMETYGQTRSFAPVSEMVRNIAVMGFRFLDNGKIVLILVFSIGFWLAYSDKIRREILTRWLFIAVVPALVLGLAFIPFSIPLGHRYFLVSFLGIAAGAGEVLSVISPGIRKSVAIAATILILLSGHLWIYPDNISKGWDASLAHIPWYSLRREAVEYIHKNHIDPSSICSDFPNLQPVKVSDLSEDSTRFRPKEKGFGGCDFVFWSNVLNGFSDEELQDLRTNWVAEKSWGVFPVRVVLYRRKSFMAGEAKMPHDVDIVSHNGYDVHTVESRFPNGSR